MKNITALTLGIIFMSMGLGLAQQASPAEQSSVRLVEVGNKHCPVSGDIVGKMGAPIKFEYNGKMYNLCCPMCIKSFRNDPEKYSKIADDEVKGAK